MGDAKRRKEILGDQYGQEGNVYPWLPLKKSQAQKFVQWTTKGAWIGIGALVAYWVVVRFVGPAFGWWEVI
ncbi:DUF2839 domain-containing protein [Leptolyngbya sp. FACHB-711]|jgi:hypothetical protein|uniref:DUF2839 domain-containing protein n=1 Tax=unclassified Leptolyngbya TaxID=2650499 RepID=UPI0016823C02|nr:DUF2839 domain-containing protein [Leptolyngbya sp. FACHB-711]MBD1853099.1 DUF2839 domain-containing protein [Cyanobacteria bacterium FACHB-502]MBD2023631.1 DUF2839 domain-containing protein [Leptolyngbya sp. FACHB-711]